MIPQLPDEIFNKCPPEAQGYIRYLETRVANLEAHVGRLQGHAAYLIDHLAKQDAHVKQLTARIHELENRLNKNSSNSSKPPSSDGLGGKKTQSLRKPSGKKPGGQPGHQGKTLEQVSNPDQIIEHAPDTCENCQNDLTSAPVDGSEKRQVFDLPKPELEVVEHRAQTKTCSCCGHRTKAPFPEHVTAPVQYGLRIQALSAYLHNQQFVPPDRIRQFFEDIFEINISPGTCMNIDERLFEYLAPFELSLKAYLTASQILHADETGMRCEKKLYWIHSASTALATFYGIHARRGKEAIDHFDIIPNFRGWCVHDHWKPYFSYPHLQHVLCNAHHLRELKYIYEQEKEPWAQRMKEHLLHAQKLVQTAHRAPLSPEVVEQIENSYLQILIGAFHHHKTHFQNGPPAQKKKPGLNLLRRLLNQMDAVLAFVKHPVPFTNNQAEQDIRMVKVRQKISGSFRSFLGAAIFCRIRSYISTARKQGWGVWDSIVEALQNRPRLLSTASP